MSNKRFNPRRVDPGDHLPVIAAIVWDPDEYSPLMRQIWEDTKVLTQHTDQDFPAVYTGSVRGECATCHVGVALGPHQQAAIANWEAHQTPYEVHCLICAVRRVSAVQQRTVVVNLDNPEFTDD